MVCHCLLVPVGDTWTLVDAGLGAADLADPAWRLSESFVRRMRPRLDPAETAIAQVERRGIDPRAVTDIVLTHLDTDHVGGIADFPWARVHVGAGHLDLARPALRRDVVGRLHPRQWDHGPLWAPAAMGEAYAGRPATRVNDRVRLVLAEGHIEGHCAVVVERPGQPDLIHAGDAIFALEAVRGGRVPLGVAVFERNMRTDRAAWTDSRRWLRERHREGAEIIAAHAPFDVSGHAPLVP